MKTKKKEFLNKDNYWKNLLKAISIINFIINGLYRKSLDFNKIREEKIFQMILCYLVIFIIILAFVIFIKRKLFILYKNISDDSYIYNNLDKAYFLNKN